MKSRALIACLLTATMMFCLGCQPSSDNKTAGKAPSITVSESAKLTLVKADKADGKEDHKIEKCYSCALHMNGKPEYAADISGYQAHFCTESCRDKFVQDAESKIASTEIPDQN